MFWELSKAVGAAVGAALTFVLKVFVIAALIKYLSL